MKKLYLKYFIFVFLTTLLVFSACNKKEKEQKIVQEKNPVMEEINITKEEKQMLLEDAIMADNKKAVSYILKQKKGNPNQKTKNGEPVINLAARRGFTFAVEQLLVAGANVNTQDNSGETALMSIYPLDYLAPESNYKKIRDLLLGAGADINIADKRGRTALMNASFVGSVEDVKKLIEAGANVNAAESDGDTALIIASTGMDSEGYDDEKNKNQIVELLLNAGADQKEKALIAAIDSNFPVIVKTLLARGINTKGKSGEELLRVASQAGMLELVKMLLANKVNVNAVDEQGRTALLQATSPCGTGICDDRVGVAKALLKAGADVNLANKDGQTPLFYATYPGDTEMVQLLLEAGADVTVKMKDGETVLQRAQKEEYTDIVKLLKAAGAKE